MMKQSTIVLLVILIVVLIGALIFFWINQTSKEETVPEINQNVGVPSQDIIEKVEGNTYEGLGYSYTFPEGYTVDDQGIWTEEGYEKHLNPPANCSTCQIPYIEVKSEMVNEPLAEYVLNSFDLPSDYPYETIKIGDKEYIKISVTDLHDVTAYYTKEGDRFVGFIVYFEENDNEVLQEIISSLKFN